MAEGAVSSGGRVALYRALRRRNRTITALRVLVPLLGLVVFAVLAAQLVLANLAKDFSIGHVSIERDRLKVEAPSYSGRLGDDAIYTVSAATAEAALGAPSVIDLTDASVSLNRTDGVQSLARAASAQLDSDKQLVDVTGVTDISDSTGNAGTLAGMHIDFPAQKLSTSGPVRIVFSKGQTLDAAAMSYDATAKLWQFSRVTLTMPGTPGATTP